MKLNLTRKDILFIANAIFFCFMVFCLFFEWGVLAVGPHKTLLRYVLIQCVFTILSLIVYYLSIIANALERKTKNEESNDTANSSPYKIAPMAWIIIIIAAVVLFILDFIFITF